MGITFTCSACGKSFTVDERLAGRRGKCKSCGAPFQVPAAESAGGLSVDDLYGADDGTPAAPLPPRPKTKSVPRRTAARDPKPALPSWAGGKDWGVVKKPRRSAGASGSGPWGVPFRKGGAVCLLVGAAVVGLYQNVPAIREAVPGMALLSQLAALLCLVGMLLTLISFVGAAASAACGNSEAFTSESSASLVGWILSGLFSVLLLVAISERLARPGSRLALLGGGTPTGSPGAPAGVPGPGGGGGGGPAGVPGGGFPFGGGGGFGSEVRSDVWVALSGGQFMRNTSMVGTAQPGVEISIDYRVESGQLAPGEHYVLVIKSGKGRGELDNLHEIQFRPSGTINASSFMASPEQGPYEAWMEVASSHGPMGRRSRCRTRSRSSSPMLPCATPARRHATRPTRTWPGTSR